MKTPQTHFPGSAGVSPAISSVSPKIPRPSRRSRNYLTGALLLLTSIHVLTLASPAQSPTETNQNFAEAPPVEPKPVVNQSNIVFVGISGITEADLRAAGAEVLNSIAEKGLTAPRADDAAFYTKVYYRRHGYTFATVDWQIINGGHTLELTVQEGPLTVLGETTYQDNWHYAKTQLDDFLLGTTRERFSKFKKDLPYVETDIETGVGRLVSFYKSEGYLDVKVLPWPIEYTADLSVAKLGFTIQEGLLYWFRRINIQGVSPDLEAKLRTKIAETLKSPATELRMDNLHNDFKFELKSLGYFKATVELTSITFDSISGLVDVDILVDSGEIYRYDGITVKGLDSLDPDFLPARFSSLSGQTYDPAKFDEVYREIVGTGLFTTLQVKEVPLPDNTIRLDFTADEAKAKELGFYLGFGSYEGGFVGASYQDRNLFGRGRPLLTSLEISQRGINGEVEYIDPWYFGRGNEFRVKVYSRSFDNDGYSIFDLGARVELSRKFSKVFKAAAFVALKTAKTTPLGIDETILLGPLSYQTVSLGVSATLDYRNNPLSPERGFVADSSLGYEFSGGASGLRAAIRLSYYLPIGKGLLALGARSSAFLASGDANEVPIDERYFNGGANTVRSFDERQLGPLYRNQYPLGGLSRTILNAEFTYPIYGDIKGAVFYDAGNVTPKGSFFSATDFRHGVGLGVRYDLPIGALRLDYGMNPSPREGEAAGAFHFSFGVAF